MTKEKLRSKNDGELEGGGLPRVAVLKSYRPKMEATRAVLEADEIS